MDHMQNLILPFHNPLTAVIDERGVWHLTIFVGLCVVVVAYINKVMRNLLSYPEKILLGYVLCYSLSIFEFPSRAFGIYTMAYQVTAAQVFAEALLIPLGAFTLFKPAMELLPYIVLGELICVWSSWPGLMVAPSFNTAFCALAIPFVSPWVKVAVLVTALTHHGTTALIIIAAQLLAFVIRRPRKGWALAGTVVPMLLVAAYFNSGALFNGADRLARYREFMTVWASDWSYILRGVGPGSFMWKSLEASKFQGDLFLQLHSDWLQILWELGLLGLGWAVAVFISAAKNVWNEPRLLSALFGAAAFMVTYHPLRFFPTAFLTALILFSCKTGSYRADPSKQSNPAHE